MIVITAFGILLLGSALTVATAASDAGTTGKAGRILAAAATRLAEIEAVPFRSDAVFSDVVMPGMGGIELAKRLRQLHPDLPVILTSGHNHVLASDAAHDFEFVRKPYSAEQVGRVLRAATARMSKVRAAWADR